MRHWAMLLAAALLVPPATAAEAPAAPEGLRVEVTGEASRPPDTATILFSLVQEGDTVEAVREAAAKKHQAVAQALAAKQIPAKEIAEAYVSLTPVRPRNERGAPTGPALGYVLVRGFRVVVPVTGAESMPRVLDLLSAVVTAGGEPPRWREGGSLGPSSPYYEAPTGEMLQFGLKDVESLVREAVTTATARARQVAGAIAKTDGFAVGPIREVTVRTDAGVPTSPGVGLASAVWQPIRLRLPVTVTFAPAPR